MSQDPTRFHHDQPFEMKRGGTLPGLTLAYETWGELNEARNNVVAVFTGMSPSAHAASSAIDSSSGWWEPMIGPGKSIDTDRWFVVCVNSLGSCKGSTGPASDNPATGEPWGVDFPPLAIEDMAASSNLLFDHLGIRDIKVVVGPSMGGMTALAYLRLFPKKTQHMLCISSAYRAEPYGIAIRSLQREAICSDRLWNNGKYTDENWPQQGMRFARKLGTLTYRSSIEWEHRFGRDRQDRYEETAWGMNFQIESYLEAAADRFVRQFDPTCYLYLSKAIDWFDASEGAASLEDVLGPSGLVSACVIGIETDILYPLRQQVAIADALRAIGCKVDFYAFSSHHGHDAFLSDYDTFVPIVRDYFKTLDDQ